MECQQYCGSFAAPGIIFGSQRGYFRASRLGELAIGRAEIAKTGSLRLRAWHVVRVSPAPPRSLALPASSCLLPNGPELAGFLQSGRSLRCCLRVQRGISCLLSLASKNLFLAQHREWRSSSGINLAGRALRVGATIQLEHRAGGSRRCPGAIFPRWQTSQELVQGRQEISSC